VTLKAEQYNPLYSLKIACSTIVEAAKSTGTLHYLNLELIVQAQALKGAAPVGLERLHDGSLPLTRSVDSWSYTNDTHFQNMALRDHHLPDEECRATHAVLKSSSTLVAREPRPRSYDTRC